MKLKFALIAAFAAATLSLTACGGGNSSPSQPNPDKFTSTDVVVGTGADAVAGKTATVTYSGWLYSDTAADHKGTKFDAGSDYAFLLGANKVIVGFEKGVTGMKVGGKRTVLIPSSEGYGAGGNPPVIPPNAGLVFDIELTKVQ